MENLFDRVAVVTGGGDGIGRGIAHALAKVGVKVAVCDIDIEAAERVALELRLSGRESFSYYVNVVDADSMFALGQKIEKQLGPITILCNNAGVMLEGSIVNAPKFDWDWIFDVNLHGIVNGVNAFASLIKKNGGGHIVNTASMAGLTPPLQPDSGIYSSSKAAVVSYSENLSSELSKDGIDVSVLCPSRVNTRIWEANRNRPESYGRGRSVTKPEEAADSIDGMEVGPIVVRSILQSRFYIFTGDDVRMRIEKRNQQLMHDIKLHEDDLEPGSAWN
ncbi:MAG: SDR family NAD(P)-dependent oxidoreductase [Dehalococcoidia bacterium]|nr:SDR family NAD(P)-dependent oxidoreductase [Dehalococcoidia bacterium]